MYKNDMLTLQRYDSHPVLMTCELHHNRQTNLESHLHRISPNHQAMEFLILS